jgi:hypothetical protein
MTKMEVGEVSHVTEEGMNPVLVDAVKDFDPRSVPKEVKSWIHRFYADLRGYGESQDPAAAVGIIESIQKLTYSSKSTNQPTIDPELLLGIMGAQVHRPDLFKDFGRKMTFNQK